MLEELKNIAEQQKADLQEMKEKRLKASGLNSEQAKHLRIIGIMRIVAIVSMLVLMQPYQMVIHTYFLLTFFKLAYLNISSSQKSINELKENPVIKRMLETMTEEFVLKMNKFSSLLLVPATAFVLYWLDQFIIDIASNYIK